MKMHAFVIKKKKKKLFLVEIFYLTTSTPGLSQELRKLCDWPESK